MDFASEKYYTKLKQYDNIFVYGCGHYGLFLYKTLVELGTGKDIYFCETIPNYKTKHGVAVFSPEEILEKSPDALFCMGAPTNRESILQHLEELGVPESNILNAYELEKQYKQRKHSRIPGILIPLAEHCNLNCAGCLNFSSIAKKEFADLQTIKEDLIRLNEIFSDGIPSVGLFGGEPLLHPQTENIIEDVRQILPSSHLFILTNGILLAAMPESFWQKLRQNNVRVAVSRYPITLDNKLIMRKADAFGAKVVVNEFRKDSWQKHPIDIEGGQDPEESFLSCPFANGQCIIVSKGKLYPCITVYSAGHFNRKFNQNLLRADKDSMDIYSDVAPDDIFSFLASPIPFCRYCDIKNRKKVAWRLSKQEISEFIE